MAKSKSESGGVLLGRKQVRRKPAQTAEMEAGRLPSGFPRDLRDLKIIKTLGGSTGARLVEDSKGNQFVMKKGNSPDHLREEAATDAIYRAAGVDVPEFRLYETKSGPVKLAKFKKGTSLSDLQGAAREQAYADLGKHFALDAIVGNWDVVGLAYDNVLMVGGKPMRIDNGGSLRYRAQGGLKTSLPKAAHFDSIPNEIFTLRNSSINGQTAKVFSKLPYSEIMQQGKALYKKRAALIKAAPPALKATLGARLDYLNKLAGDYSSRKAKGESDQAIQKRHNLMTTAAKGK